MSDLAALLAAHAAQPMEDMPLLAIADLLEEQYGGEVTCLRCSGSGKVRHSIGYPAQPHETLEVSCSECFASGILRAYDFRYTVALHRVLSYPDQDWPRLEYAELLEANAGEAVCTACSGEGCSQHGHGDQSQRCNSTGRVSDGRRERAEFIRVQVERALIPVNSEIETAEDARRNHTLMCREVGLLSLKHWPQWIPKIEGITFYRDGLSTTYLNLIGLGFRRGFIDSLTCTAADWLLVHEAVYWHPGQTVACPECGQYTNRYATSLYRLDCSKCDGTGRIPRPFVTTAQPITKIVLTTDFEGSEDNHGFSSMLKKKWPTIIFEFLNS